ncbi:unnamed protein product [Rotaria sordida]|uniref:Uncharacterized protein n=1 Tax=Rotaria sordida TaxID=392033 RepID=A0A813X1T1_9BILA|nr:unnamed protein product [Rotaria sordida]CAF0869240.1 unnamed protein product [Rotaria sordida]CAF3603965.1 unnamed protein product [Rotaria sordida]
MENEYKFNYDEIKRIFESVPQTNSTNKKCKPIPYKNHFQARTNPTVVVKNDKESIQTISNTNKLMTNQINPIPTRILFNLQRIRVYQITYIEQFCFQKQYDFYVLLNIMQ